MLQVNFIKENFSKVVEGLKKRNKDFSKDLKNIIDLNEDRKKQQAKLDSNLSIVNNLSKKIGELFKNNNVVEANKLKKEVENLKPEIKELQDFLNEVNFKINELLCSIPNVPNKIVEKGKNEIDNEIVFESGIEIENSYF